MKKLIFALIGALTILTPFAVKATTSRFYEAEYMKYTWNRVTEDNIKFYQQARVYREQGTNNHVYCIEPFTGLNDSKDYYSTITPENLTKEQVERVSQIAHFGYNYKDHYDMKWYAISQIMIWRTVKPNADFYFTNKLNGNRITLLEDEKNQIESLIKEYNTLPSFSNNIYNIVKDETLTIEDNNNVINTYKTTSDKVIIEGNKIQFKNLNLGENIITFEKTDTYYNKPLIFYQAAGTQNLLMTGDMEPKTFELKIIVKETEIKINKLDKDTNSNENLGKAKLEGAIYQLYDSNMTEIAKLIIDETHQSTIKNLKYGKYFLKEIKAGEGYELDNTIYPFELTKENPNIELNLYNQVIKANIIINKKYLLDDTQKPEENISFNIYDENNHLIKTITTNELGIAEVTLNYGKYKVEQITTTTGYDTIETFEIVIENNEEQTFNLLNHKIKVPYTSSYKQSLIMKILSILLLYIINV